MSTDLGYNNGDEVVHQAHLPALTYEGGDCERDVMHLSLQEWAQLGDGLIYGKIASIEPYVETTIDVKDKTYVHDPAQCAQLEGALRIELKDMKGYLFDADIASLTAVTMGPDMRLRFGDFTPTVENGRIKWPKDMDPMLQVGMVIGGPVFYHATNDTWTFAYGPIMPMFEVVQGLVQFQDYQQLDEHGCGVLPPIARFGGKPLETLNNELQALSQGDTLYIPAKDRRWSIGDDETAEKTEAGAWMGECYSQAYLDQIAYENNPECRVASDCSTHSDDCIHFRCVPAPEACETTKDCAKGNTCHKGTCGTP